MILAVPSQSNTERVASPFVFLRILLDAAILQVHHPVEIQIRFGYDTRIGGNSRQTGAMPCISLWNCQDRKQLKNIGLHGYCTCLACVIFVSTDQGVGGSTPSGCAIYNLLNPNDLGDYL